MNERPVKHGTIDKGGVNLPITTTKPRIKPPATKQKQDTMTPKEASVFRLKKGDNFAVFVRGLYIQYKESNNSQTKGQNYHT